MFFRDRTEAGKILASKLLVDYGGHHDVVVLGLPRGGIPVAFEVARELEAPLDVFMVRKLGVPGHEELAMGAIAEDDVIVLNDPVMNSEQISEMTVERVIDLEKEELVRRDREYRETREPVEVEGKTVILVDDGLATGSTMRAAIAALHKQGVGKLVVAIPIAAMSTCEELRLEADDLVCLSTPSPFYAVGVFYQNFSQTSDDEVREFLAESEHWAKVG